jgi:hypothetical protein
MTVNWIRYLLLLGLIMNGSAQASEIELGSGTMQLEGGILGLQGDNKSRVTTYRMKENHENIRSTDWFYNYQVAYYTAEPIDVLGSTVGALGGDFLEVSGTEYNVKGFDGQATFGYNVYSEGEYDYIGLGVSLGIAVPYLENSGEDSSGSTSDSTSDSGTDAGTAAADFLYSTTEFMGYKVGPRLMVSKSLGKYASVYGEVSYAWQTLSMTNETLGLNLDVDGTYFSYDLGFRYQPIKYKYDMGIMTLEPSLYMTFGVNYSELIMEDLALDLSGYNYLFEASQLKMSSTTLYMGLGYAF